MKKKKNKKCYISCRSIQKMDYQRALLTRYSLMFTNALEDADIFFAPMDSDGRLTSRQRREIEKAETLGLSQRVITMGELVLDSDEKDPLRLEPDRDDDLKKEPTWELIEDDSLELELV